MGWKAVQNRAIVQIKVQWKNFIPEEETWEMEEKNVGSISLHVPE